MFGFIVAWVLLTISVGLIIGWIATIWMDDDWKRWIVIAIIAIIVGSIFTGLFWLEGQAAEKLWNNGLCPTCSTHWTPNGATRSRYGSVTKYYYCPECFMEISIPQ